MTGPIIFAVLISLAVLAFASERAVARVREAQARYKATMARKQQQVERIRKTAQASLELKRELRAINRQFDDLRRQAATLEKEMRAASRPENRIFVLDERRTPADEGWIVTLAAPPPEADRAPPPWSGSRRFLVWAADEETARTKVARRYLPAAGYQVVSAAPRPKQAAKRGAPAPAG